MGRHLGRRSLLPRPFGAISSGGSALTTSLLDIAALGKKERVPYRSPPTVYAAACYVCHGQIAAQTFIRIEGTFILLSPIPTPTSLC